MRTAFLAIWLLLSIPFASFAAEELSLSGHWYMEGVEHDNKYQSLLENRDDGTLEKTIQDVTNCQSIYSWIETGTWQFDGRIYRQVTETVDGESFDTSDPYLNDSFDITRVDSAHIAAYDPKTKITRTMAQVPAEFKIPPAKHCAI